MSPLVFDSIFNTLKNFKFLKSLFQYLGFGFCMLIEDCTGMLADTSTMLGDGTGSGCCDKSVL